MRRRSNGSKDVGIKPGITRWVPARLKIMNEETEQQNRRLPFRTLACYVASLSQKRVASELKLEASLNVSTKIHKWLRENPNATPEEAGFEFLQRYEAELNRLTSAEAA